MAKGAELYMHIHQSSQLTNLSLLVSTCLHMFVRISRLGQGARAAKSPDKAGAAEVVRPVWPWPYQYLRPIIMGVVFCGCVSS